MPTEPQRDTAVLHLEGPALPPNLEFERTDGAAHIVASVLGPAGRMISSSKSRYYERYPGHVVAFNANVFSKKLGKLWWGDLDVTVDRAALQEVADGLGEEIVVLREMDGRFERADDPAWDRPVATFAPSDRSSRPAPLRGEPPGSDA